MNCFIEKMTQLLSAHDIIKDSSQSIHCITIEVRVFKHWWKLVLSYFLLPILSGLILCNPLSVTSEKQDSNCTIPFHVTQNIFQLSTLNKSHILQEPYIGTKKFKNLLSCALFMTSSIQYSSVLYTRVHFKFSDLGGRA